ncbi:zinc finger protein with SET domain, putative [Babesia caballi]|uniref:Zinc finger protein with SET domain, putative n=1 Tax=Babesia caballi TaxID=5871 RepID=A0AAV4M0F7_BABCB|nr:zinc finger protein with SET domain, putative [Babesia caballi]
MSEDVVDGTLGPLLGLKEWIEALQNRSGLHYYAQAGQYGGEAVHLARVTRDEVFKPTPGSSKITNGAQNPPLSPSTHCKAETVTNDKAASNPPPTNSAVSETESTHDANAPAPTKPLPTEEPNKQPPKAEEKLASTAEAAVADQPPRRGRGLRPSHCVYPQPDAATFATEFFGAADEMHVIYHWNKLDRRVLTSARERGLEPTTLGHVLARRGKLWAQTQCIHRSAKADFEKHLNLYQRQFEKYSRSGDGWISVDADYKEDSLFQRQPTYLTGAKNVTKVLQNVPGCNALPAVEQNESSAGGNAPADSSQKSSAPTGKYNWNNVIYCPNMGDCGEIIHRNARRTLRLYKNLYDCLVHGWVHPGLVVCEVKDATHPIRFATPSDQDCYTVVYAGPPIPDNSTQRVIFGEYTGVVYREESLEESLFEYAFELNFSPASWINADVELSKDNAEIEEHGDLVLLPSNAKFVLDSSQACNELSLVNHYQSVKVYGGEKWVVPNCEWQQVFLDGWPHVVLTSKLGVSINPGDELVADFGALWFSKVEETAHKFIRNELIEYRLGRAIALKPGHQVEVPRRPLTNIDSGLKSNSIATAGPTCAICYKAVEDNLDGSMGEESGSASCDGCDRFFHITCIRTLSAASAVHLSKDGSGHAWIAGSGSKGVSLGSGKLYCSFCRHLAKMIYMHDAGCDYMPLAKGVVGASLARRALSPLGSGWPDRTVYRSDQSSASAVPPHMGRNIRDGGDGGSDRGELLIDRLARQQAAEDRASRSLGAIHLMRPSGTPSLFDLALADRRKRVYRSASCHSLDSERAYRTLSGSSASDSQYLSGAPSGAQMSPRKDRMVSSARDTPTFHLVRGSPDLSPNPVRRSPGSCPTCLRRFSPRYSQEGRSPFETDDDDEGHRRTPLSATGKGSKGVLDISRHLAPSPDDLDGEFDSACRIIINAKKKAAENGAKVATKQQADGSATDNGNGQNNSNHAEGAMSTGGTHPNRSPEPSSATSVARSGENPRSANDGGIRSTSNAPGPDARNAAANAHARYDRGAREGHHSKNYDAYGESPRCEGQYDQYYGHRQHQTRHETGGANDREVFGTHIPHAMRSPLRSMIPTSNIGRAVNLFKTMDKSSGSPSRQPSPERGGSSKAWDDTTIVDYLGCKYLAGMWQVEPFALFGDSVRVCTDCYAENGVKANVYVCRLLKRHLMGNFDHPMNTNPTQMRELVLMAYEQHVQMLLRLLVLKNIAIKFMCRLCCHFVGRQLFHQKQEVNPPLPFPADFMGQDSGAPEGILASPEALIDESECESARRLRPQQVKLLQSHLSSFVTSVKNTVCTMPISSKAEPTLNFELLVAMGAFNDEFSRLANCNGIVEYLNDLMSHKVLDADSTPGQLQQMLTKDELRRFTAFRHLSERLNGPLGANQAPVHVRKRHRGPTFVPLLGIVPGRSFIYRNFKDGYYKGMITNYVEVSAIGKPAFLVTYSDGDDEMLSPDDLLKEVTDNLYNFDAVIHRLSPNDMRNEDVLLRMRRRGDRSAVSIVESLRREMVRSLTLHRSFDAAKRADPSKKHAPARSVRDSPKTVHTRGGDMQGSRSENAARSENV